MYSGDKSESRLSGGGGDAAGVGQAAVVVWSRAVGAGVAPTMLLPPSEGDAGTVEVAIG
jgi:hypothetical protein